MFQTELTQKQIAFCRYIDSYQQRNGIGPTLEEIAAGLRLSGRSSARQHLRLVAKKGHVEYVPHSARSIRLTEKWRQFLNRQADRQTNPIVDRVAESRAHLFDGWTADEWVQLRSVRGMGGAMTEQAVVRQAEAINENRRVRELFEALLASSVRGQVIDWVKEMYGQIDAKDWMKTRRAKQQVGIARRDLHDDPPLERCS